MACIAALEVAAALTEPMVAVIGYAVLLLAMVNQIAVAVSRVPTNRKEGTAALIVLAAGPLLRLVTLTLESAPVHPVRHYALIGTAAGLIASSACIAFPGLRPRLFVTRGRAAQLLVGMCGIPVGLLLSLAIRPASLGPQHGWLHATPFLLALVIGAAVVEEVLFRGLLETVFVRVFGGFAPILSTASLALVYLNVHPASFVCAAIIVGFSFALMVERTGVISGVVLGHVAINVGWFYVWPRILDLH
jgi:membrane protease YdiL (CAAX protease family)